jgi:hypothetical protein
MSLLQLGKPFVGVFSSADASGLSEANSRFTLTLAGQTAAYSLASDEQVLISDVDLVAGAALTVTLYDGSDTTAGAGEQILAGSFAANGGISSHNLTPHACQQASYPKVKTSGAGQIDCTIRGVIVRHGQ